jgi:hypothetical protein
MQIDNSMAASFRECPWKYYEQYVRNGKGVQLAAEPGEAYSSLEFGARMHELLEEYYRGYPLPAYMPHANEKLEAEAEVMIAAYRVRYPGEDLNLDIVSVEQTFNIQLPNLCSQCYSLDHVVNAQHPGVPEGLLCEKCREYFLPDRHSLVGKMDLVTRTEGKIDITDHKTEKRGAKSNLPQKWGAKDQASLYLWALKKLYPNEEIGNFYVNVLTRQSEKGLIGPSFPPERQKLERNERAIEIAIRDIVVVADEIERYMRIFGDDEWPANRELCYGWGYCPYYQLHRYGEDVSEILKYKYTEREEYLHLGGVPIIQ